MRILVFSDVHGDVAALRRLLAIEADYYIAAGDLVSWGRGLDHVGKTLATRAERMYVLPGNHETQEMVDSVCDRYGLQAFHGRTMELDGFYVAGLGYSSPTPFNTPGEYTEQEMARQLQRFAGLDPLVLVCHAPPLGTQLDRMSGDVHAGSRAVRDFIDKHQPAAFFCGHIHEAHGVSETIGRTRAWNTGKQGVLLDSDTIKS
jgi:Icc-related predicted phosphoesterase